jgi:hypothetical protein
MDEIKELIFKSKEIADNDGLSSDEIKALEDALENDFNLNEVSAIIRMVTDSDTDYLSIFNEIDFMNAYEIRMNGDEESYINYLKSLSD